jgi:hypothetical protein
MLANAQHNKVEVLTVAPVMHIDVLTGSLYCEKIKTVIAAPNSMEQPLLGE